MKQILNMFLPKKAYLLTLLLLAVGMNLNAASPSISTTLTVANGPQDISVDLKFPFVDCYTSEDYILTLKVTNDQNIGEVEGLALNIPVDHNRFIYNCYDVDSGSVTYDGIGNPDTVKWLIPRLDDGAAAKLSLTLKLVEFREPATSVESFSIGVWVTGCIQPDFSSVTTETREASTLFDIYSYKKPVALASGCFPNGGTVTILDTMKIVDYNWTNNSASASNNTIYWCDPVAGGFITIDESVARVRSTNTPPSGGTYAAVNGTQNVEYSYIGSCGEPGLGDTLDVFFALDIRKHYSPELDTTNLRKVSLTQYDNNCNPLFENIESLNKPKVLIPRSGGLEDIIQLNSNLSVEWEHTDLNSNTSTLYALPVDNIYPPGQHTIKFNFRYDYAPIDSVSSASTTFYSPFRMEANRNQMDTTFTKTLDTIAIDVSNICIPGGSISNPTDFLKYIDTTCWTPKNGTAKFIFDKDGNPAIQYISNENYKGVDSIGYELIDKIGESLFSVTRKDTGYIVLDVRPNYNLKITKSANKRVYEVEDTITFISVIENVGSNDIDSIVIVDSIKLTALLGFNPSDTWKFLPTESSFEIGTTGIQTPAVYSNTNLNNDLLTLEWFYNDTIKYDSIITLTYKYIAAHKRGDSIYGGEVYSMAVDYNTFGDVDSSNNYDTCAFSIIDYFDLKVDKYILQNTNTRVKDSIVYNLGDTVNVHFTFTNHSSTKIDSIVIEDTIPSGLSVVSFNNSMVYIDPPVAINSGADTIHKWLMLTTTPVDVKDSTHSYYTLKVVKPGIWTNKSNVGMSLDPDFLERNTANNVDSVKLGYELLADLEFTKSALKYTAIGFGAGQNTFYKGDSLTYYFYIRKKDRNNKQSITNIVISDTISTDTLEILSKASSNPNSSLTFTNISSNRVVMRIEMDSISYNHSYSIHVKTKIVVDTFINWAYMTFAEKDTVYSDTAQIEITPDYTIETTARLLNDPANVRQGDNLTYEVKLAHTAASATKGGTAKNVVLRARPFPAQNQVAWLGDNVHSYRINHNGADNPYSGQVISNYTQWEGINIPTGDTAIITINVKADNNATRIDSFAFFHLALGSDRSLDTAWLDTVNVKEVNYNLNLKVSQIDDQGNLVTEDNTLQKYRNFDIKINYKNERDEVTNVVLTDTLHSDLYPAIVYSRDPSSATPISSAPGVTPAPDTIKWALLWNIGNMDANKSDSIIMTIQGLPIGNYAQKVDIKCDELEVSFNDNMVLDTVKVMPKNNLKITLDYISKYPSVPDSVTEGDTIQIRLTVENTSNIDIVDRVEVSLPIPKDTLSLLGSAGNGYTFNPTTNTLRKDISLAAGESQVATFTLVVMPVSSSISNAIVILKAEGNYSEGVSKEDTCKLRIGFLSTDILLDFSVNPTSWDRSTQSGTPTFTYTNRVDKYNSAEQDFSSVILHDTLPAWINTGAAVISPAPDNITTLPDGRSLLVWDITQDINTNLFLNVTIGNCEAPDNIVGQHVASARVFVDKKERNVLNNQDIATLTIVAGVSLEVTLTPKDSSLTNRQNFEESDTVVLEIKVANNGTSHKAENVKVAIPKPTGLTAVRDSGGIFSLDRDTLYVKELGIGDDSVAYIYYTSNTTGRVDINAKASADSIDIGGKKYGSESPLASTWVYIEEDNAFVNIVFDHMVATKWPISLSNLDYFKIDSNLIRIQITVKNIGNKISDSVSIHLEIPEDQFKLSNGDPAPSIYELPIAQSLSPGQAGQTITTLTFNKPGNTFDLKAKAICENDMKPTPAESGLLQDIVIRPNPFNVSLEFIKTDDKNFATDREDPLSYSVYATGDEMLHYTLRAANIGDSTAKNIEIGYRLNSRYITLSKASTSPNPSIGAAAINNNVLHWTISELGKGETADLDMVADPLLSSKNIDSAKITVNDGVVVRNVWDEDDLSDNSASTVIEIFPIVEKWTVMQSFSPNGDGLNDQFVIQELNDPRFADNEITIFNRYGTEVFRAKPYTNNWDATGLPDGTYFYKLTINLENGQKQEKTNYITIRRSRKK